MKRTLSTITKKVKPTNTRIKVEVNSYTEVTREADPDDAWGADDTATSNYFTGIKITHGGIYDLLIPYPIVKGKTYYLVVATYSTGDSFSHHTGRYEIIDMYSSAERAEIAKRSIEDDYRANPDEYSVTFINCKGAPQKIHCSWKGYFESLESVEVTSVQLS